jgi:hypothetical protein
MGRAFIEFLDDTTIFICSSCQNHLSSESELISKVFQSFSSVLIVKC